MTRVAYPLVTGLLSLLLAGPVEGAVPAETQPADVEQENAALKEKVAQLEARVKKLERELRDVRAGSYGQLRITPAPTPVPSIPRAVPESPYMPNTGLRVTPAPAPREGWQERHVNGIRFYLVPLKTDGQAPTSE